MWKYILERMFFDSADCEYVHTLWVIMDKALSHINNYNFAIFQDYLIVILLAL